MQKPANYIGAEARSLWHLACISNLPYWSLITPPSFLSLASALQAAPAAVLGLGHSSPLRPSVSPCRSRSPSLHTGSQLATPVVHPPLHEADSRPISAPTSPLDRQPCAVAAPVSAPGEHSAGGPARCSVCQSPHICEEHPAVVALPCLHPPAPLPPVRLIYSLGTLHAQTAGPHGKRVTKSYLW